MGFVRSVCIDLGCDRVHDDNLKSPSTDGAAPSLVYQLRLANFGVGGNVGLSYRGPGGGTCPTRCELNTSGRLASRGLFLRAIISYTLNPKDGILEASTGDYSDW